MTELVILCSFIIKFFWLNLLDFRSILWSFQILIISFVQALEDGDMALLDMGAEYHFYGSDITCSFPVSLAIMLVK